MTLLETLPGVHRWCCTWCGRLGLANLLLVGRPNRQQRALLPGELPMGVAIDAAEEYSPRPPRRGV